MANTSNTPNPTPVTLVTPAQTVCKVCGKTLTNPTTASAGIGHLCAKGLPANRVVVASIPAGYITLANLGRTLRAQKATIAGLTISKLVRAIGNDKGTAQPANPIAQPLYCNGQRYVNPWLGTKAGLQAIASNNWAKAPAPAKL